MLLLIIFIAAIDTCSTGIFKQERIGQFGVIFNIYKMRTLKKYPDSEKMDASYFGKLLRSTKLDELPQLINILQGNMSIVGPRPDIEKYYNHLEGAQLLMLNLKP